LSSSRAIAAVTEHLVRVLSTRVGVTVTAKPPDKSDTSPLNVFLYQANVNAAWRNQDLPRPAGRGQPSRPLLPLNLYYLLTASGGEEGSATSDVIRHESLGKAMLVLHDEPELRGFSATSGIKNQVDPIRVTHQPLNVEEMSKLWTMFQSEYRPSVAYEVGVVLIESELTSPAPLPVMARGPQDRGWDSTSLPPAALEALRFRTSTQPGALNGESVTLMGRSLNQPGVAQVILTHMNQGVRVELDVDQRSDTALVCRVTQQNATIPAGLYAAHVQYTRGTGDAEHITTSTRLPLAVLPQIVVPAGGLQAVADAGDLTLTFRFQPALLDNQRAQLLIGSVAIKQLEQVDAGRLRARWKSAELKLPNEELPIARLRVDGVDSMIYDPDQPNTGFDPRFVVQIPN
jgi:hypothetical protein